MTTIDTIEIVPQAPIRAASTTGRTLPLRNVMSFLAWIEKVLEYRRSRLALLEMTDDQLKDIGLSRADAHREGNRPFWD